MRFAIISDVHGNYCALDAVLADIARRGVDATLNLGDVLAGPFDPIAVADRLMAESLPTVRGNHDRWIADGREDDWAVDAWVRQAITRHHLEWLRSFPATRVFEDEVFMSHATPQDDITFWMDRFDDTHGVVSMPRDYIEDRASGIDYPVLLCGHSHVPRTVRLADGRLLVNPGSVGLPFMIGSPDAHYGIIEKRNGQWSAELISIPYDKTPAMEQAHSLGFPGFATALQTGWVSVTEL